MWITRQPSRAASGHDYSDAITGYNPDRSTVRSITEEAGRAIDLLSATSASTSATGREQLERLFQRVHAVIVLDSARPCRSKPALGTLTETFGEFVEGCWSLLPLTISVQNEDTRYDWRFGYEPTLAVRRRPGGESRRLGEELEGQQCRTHTAPCDGSSAAQQRAAATGQSAMQVFLDANRHWLLPVLAERRGMVYEYRQEAPYMERVFFDPDGNLFARLEASKESPDRPTREILWLADGRKATSDREDTFVTVERTPPMFHLQQVSCRRTGSYFAMASRWIALTQLAREPDAFGRNISQLIRANTVGAAPTRNAPLRQHNAESSPGPTCMASIMTAARSSVTPPRTTVGRAGCVEPMN
jgi:hypothetical protein